ncbi:hypothetical protein AB0P21_19640 [Kribbella sp. NPDC056861]|uniref:hypothetical protein n=1 Tax=Kribbella sp. NPDC056861 TaxID=3154857 RepID=UPI00342311A7
MEDVLEFGPAGGVQVRADLLTDQLTSGFQAARAVENLLEVTPVGVQVRESMISLGHGFQAARGMEDLLEFGATGKLQLRASALTGTPGPATVVPSAPAMPVVVPGLTDQLTSGFQAARGMEDLLEFGTIGQLQLRANALTTAPEIGTTGLVRGTPIPDSRISAAPTEYVSAGGVHLPSVSTPLRQDAPNVVSSPAPSVVSSPAPNVVSTPAPSAVGAPHTPMPAAPSQQVSASSLVLPAEAHSPATSQVKITPLQSEPAPVVDHLVARTQDTPGPIASQDLPQLPALAGVPAAPAIQLTATPVAVRGSAISPPTTVAQFMDHSAAVVLGLVGAQISRWNKSVLPSEGGSYAGYNNTLELGRTTVLTPLDQFFAGKPVSRAALRLALETKLHEDLHLLAKRDADPAVDEAAYRADRAVENIEEAFTATGAVELHNDVVAGIGLAGRLPDVEPGTAGDLYPALVRATRSFVTEVETATGIPGRTVLNRLNGVGAAGKFPELAEAVFEARSLGAAVPASLHQIAKADLDNAARIEVANWHLLTDSTAEAAGTSLAHKLLTTADSLAVRGPARVIELPEPVPGTAGVRGYRAPGPAGLDDGIIERAAQVNLVASGSQPLPAAALAHPRFTPAVGAIVRRISRLSGRPQAELMTEIAAGAGGKLTVMVEQFVQASGLSRSLPPGRRAQVTAELENDLRCFFDDLSTLTGPGIAERSRRHGIEAANRLEGTAEALAISPESTTFTVQDFGDHATRQASLPSLDPLGQLLVRAPQIAVSLSQATASRWTGVLHERAAGKSAGLDNGVLELSLEVTSVLRRLLTSAQPNAGQHFRNAVLEFLHALGHLLMNSSFDRAAAELALRVSDRVLHDGIHQSWALAYLDDFLRELFGAALPRRVLTTQSVDRFPKHTAALRPLVARLAELTDQTPREVLARLVGVDRSGKWGAIGQLVLSRTNLAPGFQFGLRTRARQWIADQVRAPFDEFGERPTYAQAADIGRRAVIAVDSSMRALSQDWQFLREDLAMPDAGPAAPAPRTVEESEVLPFAPRDFRAVPADGPLDEFLERSARVAQDLVGAEVSRWNRRILPSSGRSTAAYSRTLYLDRATVLTPLQRYFAGEPVSRAALRLALETKLHEDLHFLAKRDSDPAADATAYRADRAVQTIEEAFTATGAIMMHDELIAGVGLAGRLPHAEPGTAGRLYPALARVTQTFAAEFEKATGVPGRTLVNRLNGVGAAGKFPELAAAVFDATKLSQRVPVQLHQIARAELDNVARTELSSWHLHEPGDAMAAGRSSANKLLSTAEDIASRGVARIVELHQPIPGVTNTTGYEAPLSSSASSLSVGIPEDAKVTTYPRELVESPGNDGPLTFDRIVLRGMQALRQSTGSPESLWNNELIEWPGIGSQDWLQHGPLRVDRDRVSGPLRKLFPDDGSGPRIGEVTQLEYRYALQELIQRMLPLMGRPSAGQLGSDLSRPGLEKLSTGVIDAFTRYFAADFVRSVGLPPLDPQLDAALADRLDRSAVDAVVGLVNGLVAASDRSAADVLMKLGSAHGPAAKLSELAQLHLDLYGIGALVPAADLRRIKLQAESWLLIMFHDLTEMAPERSISAANGLGWLTGEFLLGMVQRLAQRTVDARTRTDWQSLDLYQETDLRELAASGTQLTRFQQLMDDAPRIAAELIGYGARSTASGTFREIHGTGLSASNSNGSLDFDAEAVTLPLRRLVEAVPSGQHSEQLIVQGAGAIKILLHEHIHRLTRSPGDTSAEAELAMRTAGTSKLVEGLTELAAGRHRTEFARRLGLLDRVPELAHVEVPLSYQEHLPAVQAVVGYLASLRGTPYEQLLDYLNAPSIGYKWQALGHLAFDQAGLAARIPGALHPMAHEAIGEQVRAVFAGQAGREVDEQRRSAAAVGQAAARALDQTLYRIAANPADPAAWTPDVGMAAPAPRTVGDGEVLSFAPRDFGALPAQGPLDEFLERSAQVAQDLVGAEVSRWNRKILPSSGRSTAAYSRTLYLDRASVLTPFARYFAGEPVSGAELRLALETKLHEDLHFLARRDADPAADRAAYEGDTAARNLEEAFTATGAVRLQDELVAGLRMTDQLPSAEPGTAGRLYPALVRATQAFLGEFERMTGVPARVLVSRLNSVSAAGKFDELAEVVFEHRPLLGQIATGLRQSAKSALAGTTRAELSSWQQVGVADSVAAGLSLARALNETLRGVEGLPGQGLPIPRLSLPGIDDVLSVGRGPGDGFGAPAGRPASFDDLLVRSKGALEEMLPGAQRFWDGQQPLNLDGEKVAGPLRAVIAAGGDPGLGGVAAPAYRHAVLEFMREVLRYVGAPGTNRVADVAAYQQAELAVLDDGIRDALTWQGLDEFLRLTGLPPVVPSILDRAVTAADLFPPVPYEGVGRVLKTLARALNRPYAELVTGLAALGTAEKLPALVRLFVDLPGLRAAVGPMGIYRLKPQVEAWLRNLLRDLAALTGPETAVRAERRAITSAFYLLQTIESAKNGRGEPIFRQTDLNQSMTQGTVTPFEQLLLDARSVAMDLFTASGSSWSLVLREANLKTLVGKFEYDSALLMTFQHSRPLRRLAELGPGQVMGSNKELTAVLDGADTLLHELSHSFVKHPVDRVADELADGDKATLAWGEGLVTAATKAFRLEFLRRLPGVWERVPGIDRLELNDSYPNYVPAVEVVVDWIAGLHRVPRETVLGRLNGHSTSRMWWALGNEVLEASDLSKVVPAISHEAARTAIAERVRLVFAKVSTIKEGGSAEELAVTEKLSAAEGAAAVRELKSVVELIGSTPYQPQLWAASTPSEDLEMVDAGLAAPAPAGDREVLPFEPRDFSLVPASSPLDEFLQRSSDVARDLVKAQGSRWNRRIRPADGGSLAGYDATLVLDRASVLTPLERYFDGKAVSGAELRLALETKLHEDLHFLAKLDSDATADAAAYRGDWAVRNFEEAWTAAGAVMLHDELVAGTGLAGRLPGSEPGGAGELYPSLVRATQAFVAEFGKATGLQGRALVNRLNGVGAAAKFTEFVDAVFEARGLAKQSPLGLQQVEKAGLQNSARIQVSNWHLLNEGTAGAAGASLARAMLSSAVDRVHQPVPVNQNAGGYQAPGSDGGSPLSLGVPDDARVTWYPERMVRDPGAGTPSTFDDLVLRGMRTLQGQTRAAGTNWSRELVEWPGIGSQDWVRSGRELALDPEASSVLRQIFPADGSGPLVGAVSRSDYRMAVHQLIFSMLPLMGRAAAVEPVTQAGAKTLESGVLDGWLAARADEFLQSLGLPGLSPAYNRLQRPGFAKAAVAAVDVLLARLSSINRRTVPDLRSELTGAFGPAGKSAALAQLYLDATSLSAAIPAVARDRLKAQFESWILTLFRGLETMPGSADVRPRAMARANGTSDRLIKMAAELDARLRVDPSPDWNTLALYREMDLYALRTQGQLDELGRLLLDLSDRTLRICRAVRSRWNGRVRETTHGATLVDWDGAIDIDQLSVLKSLRELLHGGDAPSAYQGEVRLNGVKAAVHEFLHHTTNDAEDLGTEQIAYQNAATANFEEGITEAAAIYCTPAIVQTLPQIRDRLPRRFDPTTVSGYHHLVLAVVPVIKYVADLSATSLQRAMTEFAGHSFGSKWTALGDSVFSGEGLQSVVPAEFHDLAKQRIIEQVRVEFAQLKTGKLTWDEMGVAVPAGQAAGARAVRNLEQVVMDIKATPGDPTGWHSPQVPAAPNDLVPTATGRQNYPASSPASMTDSDSVPPDYARDFGPRINRAADAAPPASLDELLEASDEIVRQLTKAGDSRWNRKVRATDGPSSADWDGTMFLNRTRVLVPLHGLYQRGGIDPLTAAELGALEELRHELTHFLRRYGDESAGDQKAFKDRVIEDLEEGFTQAGTVAHGTGFLDRTGLLGRYQGGPLARIAYETVARIALSFSEEFGLLTGRSGSWLLDHVNGRGAAEKLPALVDAVFDAAGLGTALPAAMHRQARVRIEADLRGSMFAWGEIAPDLAPRAGRSMVRDAFAVAARQLPPAPPQRLIGAARPPTTSVEQSVVVRITRFGAQRTVEDPPLTDFDRFVENSEGLVLALTDADRSTWNQVLHDTIGVGKITGVSHWNGTLELDLHAATAPLRTLLDAPEALATAIATRGLDSYVVTVRNALTIVLHERVHSSNPAATDARAEQRAMAKPAGRSLVEGLTEAFAKQQLDAFIAASGLADRLPAIAHGESGSTAYPTATLAARSLANRLGQLTGQTEIEVLTDLARQDFATTWPTAVRKLFDATGATHAVSPSLLRPALAGVERKMRSTFRQVEDLESVSALAKASAIGIRTIDAGLEAIARFVRHPHLRATLHWLSLPTDRLWSRHLSPLPPQTHGTAGPSSPVVIHQAPHGIRPPATLDELFDRSAQLARGLAGGERTLWSRKPVTLLDDLAHADAEALADGSIAMKAHKIEVLRELLRPSPAGVRHDSAAVLQMRSTVRDLLHEQFHLIRAADDVTVTDLDRDLSDLSLEEGITERAALASLDECISGLALNRLVPDLAGGAVPARYERYQAALTVFTDRLGAYAGMSGPEVVARLNRESVARKWQVIADLVFAASGLDGVVGPGLHAAVKSLIVQKARVPLRTLGGLPGTASSLPLAGPLGEQAWREISQTVDRVRAHPHRVPIGHAAMNRVRRLSDVFAGRSEHSGLDQPSGHVTDGDIEVLHWSRLELGDLNPAELPRPQNLAQLLVRTAVVVRRRIGAGHSEWNGTVFETRNGPRGRFGCGGDHPPETPCDSQTLLLDRADVISHLSTLLARAPGAAVTLEQAQAMITLIHELLHSMSLRGQDWATEHGSARAVEVKALEEGAAELGAADMWRSVLADLGLGADDVPGLAGARYHLKYVGAVREVVNALSTPRAGLSPSSILAELNAVVPSQKWPKVAELWLRSKDLPQSTSVAEAAAAERELRTTFRELAPLGVNDVSGGATVGLRALARVSERMRLMYLGTSGGQPAAPPLLPVGPALPEAGGSSAVAASSQFVFPPYSTQQLSHRWPLVDFLTLGAQAIRRVVDTALLEQANGRATEHSVLEPPASLPLLNAFVSEIQHLMALRAPAWSQETDVAVIALQDGAEELQAVFSWRRALAGIEEDSEVLRAMTPTRSAQPKYAAAVAALVRTLAGLGRTSDGEVLAELTRLPASQKWARAVELWFGYSGLSERLPADDAQVARALVEQEIREVFRGLEALPMDDVRGAVEVTRQAFRAGSGRMRQISDSSGEGWQIHPPAVSDLEVAGWPAGANQPDPDWFTSGMPRLLTDTGGSSETVLGRRILRFPDEYPAQLPRPRTLDELLGLLAEATRREVDAEHSRWNKTLVTIRGGALGRANWDHSVSFDLDRTLTPLGTLLAVPPGGGLSQQAVQAVITAVHEFLHLMGQRGHNWEIERIAVQDQAVNALAEGAAELGAVGVWKQVLRQIQLGTPELDAIAPVVTAQPKYVGAVAKLARTLAGLGRISEAEVIAELNRVAPSAKWRRVVDLLFHHSGLYGRLPAAEVPAAKALVEGDLRLVLRDLNAVHAGDGPGGAAVARRAIPAASARMYWLDAAAAGGQRIDSPLALRSTGGTAAQVEVAVPGAFRWTFFDLPRQYPEHLPAPSTFKGLMLQSIEVARRLAGADTWHWDGWLVETTAVRAFAAWGGTLVLGESITGPLRSFFEPAPTFCSAALQMAALEHLLHELTHLLATKGGNRQIDRIHWNSVHRLLEEGLTQWWAQEMVESFAAALQLQLRVPGLLQMTPVSNAYPEFVDAARVLVRVLAALNKVQPSEVGAFLNQFGSTAKWRALVELLFAGTGIPAMGRIPRLEEAKAEVVEHLQQVYGAALVNGELPRGTGRQTSVTALSSAVELMRSIEWQAAGAPSTS